MITSRLLGAHRVTRPLCRTFNFFKKSDDTKPEDAAPPVDEVKETLTTPQDDDIEGVNIVAKRNLPYMIPNILPREAWVESLDTVDSKVVGLMDLHPEIFGVIPRLDILRKNIFWQKNYRTVNWDNPPTRCEVRRSRRKPWPQKGTGRARHGTRKSVLFKGGEVQKGNRAPNSGFYMIPFFWRLEGLRSALTVKLVQDDLKIVKNLEIPTDNPKYLEELVEKRRWGPSVLFVDICDIMPKNITLAVDGNRTFHLMPAYGLNCYSMLKFTTVVLTMDAVERIEERILERYHWTNTKFGRWVVDAEE